jgi:hypothetical protein
MNDGDRVPLKEVSRNLAPAFKEYRGPARIRSPSGWTYQVEDLVSVDPEEIVASVSDASSRRR